MGVIAHRNKYGLPQLGFTRQLSEECPKKWQKGGPLATPSPSCSTGIGLTLNFDLDIYACRKFNSLQRVNGLVVGFHDVDEALVNAHLEMLT